MPDRSTLHWSPRLALAAAIVCAAPLVAQAQGPSRLAGQWTLNPELSDQMEDKLRTALRPLSPYSTRSQRAGVPGGTRSEPAVDDRELVGVLRPVMVLEIKQDDSTVAMTDAAGYVLTIHTDGRKLKENLLSGEVLEVFAKWKDGTLSIERKQDRAGSVQERYAIEPGSGKLVMSVKLRVASLPRPLEFRRVYDRIPGS